MLLAVVGICNPIFLFQILALKPFCECIEGAGRCCCVIVFYMHSMGTGGKVCKWVTVPLCKQKLFSIQWLQQVIANAVFTAEQVVPKDDLQYRNSVHCTIQSYTKAQIKLVLAVEFT